VFVKEMSEMTVYFIGTAMRHLHLTTLIFRTRTGELKIIDRGIRYEITEGPCKSIGKDPGAGECRSLWHLHRLFLGYSLSRHIIECLEEKCASIFYLA
jgi:hypothetical protein